MEEVMVEAVMVVEMVVARVGEEMVEEGRAVVLAAAPGEAGLVVACQAVEGIREARPGLF